MTSTQWFQETEKPPEQRQPWAEAIRGIPFHLHHLLSITIIVVEGNGRLRKSYGRVTTRGEKYKLNFGVHDLVLASDTRHWVTQSQKRY
jgi:hypothetical protein